MAKVSDLPSSSESPGDLACDLLGEATDPAALSLAYAEAETFAGGRYRLGETLGSGGMGRVFRALDTTTCTEVALKVMHDGLRSDPVLAARFRGEATLLEKCDHPHVVRLLDAGEDSASGTLFMAMELMDGCLKPWLDRPLHLPRIVVWMRGACQALSHAHSLGVIHRDIKPSNLLLDSSGTTLKVADFGVARENTTAAAGPEATPATDIHALGTVFYSLLTGRPPRMGCLPPSQAAGRPRLCDTICERATSELPGRQFASALEMDAALARLEVQLANPGSPRRWLVTAAVVPIAGFLLWRLLAPVAADPPPITAGPPCSPGLLALAAAPAAASPAQAAADRPFAISDGHYFLPIPGHSEVLLAATEVRRCQFEKFATSLDSETARKLLPWVSDIENPDKHRRHRIWTDTCPLPDDAAGGISYLAAEAYCAWLTDREKSAGRIPAGAFFRLPWAVEWYAALGPDPSLLAAAAPWPIKPMSSWGDAWPPPPDSGNFPGLETEADPLRPKSWPILNYRDPFPRVAPAASFPANGHGFHDLDGNISEWAHDRATATAHPKPAHLVLGSTWALSESCEKSYEPPYDYDATAAEFRGFRLALQLAPPAIPRLHLTLYRISDTTGSADTDQPGAPCAEFNTGETVRVTWRVENFGTAAAALIGNNASATAAGGQTVWRSPRIGNKPSVGGGTVHTALLAAGQTAYFSFDMATNDWPAGPVRVSSTIHADTPESPRLETSSPGAALPWIPPDWWHDAFVLK